MEPATFSATSSRRVILGSPTKQATTGNICVPIRMPLTSESLASAPDWVTVAYDQVAESAKKYTPALEEIAGILVAFDNNKPKGKLFEDPDAKVPNASLRSFIVQRCGDEQDPDVELVFNLYCPFSREFWKWLGEMATPKNEVYMGFPKTLGKSVVIVKPEDRAQLKLADAPPSATEKEALAGDANPPKDAPAGKPGKKKSGPGELKQFHDKVTGKSR
jgi:hypothetical protein